MLRHVCRSRGESCEHFFALAVQRPFGRFPKMCSGEISDVLGGVLGTPVPTKFSSALDFFIALM